MVLDIYGKWWTVFTDSCYEWMTACYDWMQVNAIYGIDNTFRPDNATTSLAQWSVH